MNDAQQLWLRQARSDYELFVHLRRAGVHQCHLLHYLQMATEKLSKAYLWRSGNAPPRSHTGFVRFLRALVLRRGELARSRVFWGSDVDQILAIGCATCTAWLMPCRTSRRPRLEMVQTPEYPWSHEAPAHCPIGHAFALWNQLTTRGRVAG